VQGDGCWGAAAVIKWVAEARHGLGWQWVGGWGMAARAGAASPKAMASPIDKIASLGGLLV
jgi:hypothetical protein